jgi:hypothetical protein
VSQAYYDLYITSVKTLAKTMVIKSAASADAINAYVTNAFGLAVDETNPASWKYYLNMTGLYHQIDTPMTVISLDTQQTIVFNVPNLQIHLATKKAYAYGSQYYTDLVARYPLQEELILGILNPVDITAAIAAADSSILWSDPTLVESNETNLIPQLQTWINGFMFRWNVANYALVDSLYVSAQLIPLYGFLPAAILAIRFANCRTLYANTYHVQEFLASNAQLDSYMDYLQQGQALWLYRNIRYIQRNPGTQATFNWLMQNILTPQSIPLASFEMQWNVSALPDTVVPTIEYTRTPLNLGYNLAGTDIRTTTDFITEEEPLARSNTSVAAYYEVETDSLMQISLEDKLPTKILESNLTDTTDASPFTLSSMLLNEWLYMASTGQFASYVEVTNNAKAITYTLSVADAFVLYYYCFYAQYGITLTDIPVFYATCVLKSVLPTLAEMEAMVDINHVPYTWLEQALELLPTLTTYVSIQAFYDAIVELHTALLTQRLIYTQPQSFQGRAQAENAILSMYQDIGVQLSPSIDNFSDWLISRNIDLSDMTTGEFSSLASTLLASATGTDLATTTTLAATQTAMIAIMQRLSSYTVQYIAIINPSGLYVADWAAPRLGDIRRHDYLSVHINSAPTDAVGDDVHIRYKFTRDLDPTGGGLTMTSTMTQKLSAKLNVGLDCSHSKGVNHHYTIPLSKVGFTMVAPAITDITSLEEASAVVGYVYTPLTPVENALLYNTDNTYPNVASTSQTQFTES